MYLAFLTASFQVGLVVQWLGRWTRVQEVAGSNLYRSTFIFDPGQVVRTHVPLSPSSIIWPVAKRRSSVGKVLAVAAYTARSITCPETTQRSYRAFRGFQLLFKAGQLLV